MPQLKKNLSRLTILALAVSVAQSRAASAQEAVENQATAAEEEKAVPERQVVELGFFDVKDLRPTRGETAKIQFAMHLALEPTVSAQSAEQLQYWKHRLRNQVLIAIRAAELKDFLEPNLDRLRKSVRRRANRLLSAPLISEILLTEYTFSIE